MAVKASTGLRNRMLDTEPLNDILDLGFVKIYSGTPPATADATLGGATLLCTISVSGLGTGLTFEAAAVSGVLAKNAAEVWQGTNVASGEASFYRHVAPGDTGGSSTTEPRLQGTVALVGGDLNLSDVDLVEDAPQSIDYYVVALPTL